MFGIILWIMLLREDRIIQLSDNEWFKYRYVAERAGLRQGEKVVSLFYNLDGSLNETMTYSDSYLSSIHPRQNKNKFGVAEGVETAEDIADEAIEEVLDSLPWPLNWLAILLWWMIKIIWIIVSFPIKLIISLLT